MSAHHDVQVERTYIRIFVYLAGLTLLEVGVTFMPVPKAILAVVLLTMAFVKAGLVGAFYMHLKMEGTLLYIVCATPVVLVTILTVGLMPDVGKRIGAKTKVDGPVPAAHGSPSPAPSAAAH